MKIDEFNYALPSSLIAQSPVSPRDASRLLVLNRKDGSVAHRKFADLPEYFNPGDILVANDSRVIRARIFGRKSTGGRVELLLLDQLDHFRWTALVGGKRVGPGTTIVLEGSKEQNSSQELRATVTAVMTGPLREVRFNVSIEQHLDEAGHPPLPPYIHEPLADSERYQTIYARPPGSAAAPTAGLHFTPELLASLKEMGGKFERLTLHVGLDTFKPVTASNIQEHVIHSEWAQLTQEAARRINEAKLAGGRVFAVGTTTVRTLETAALRSAGVGGTLRNSSQQETNGPNAAYCPWRPVMAFEGRTDLYIYPGFEFRAVDALITNFHLPKSTLLMLVAAFAGRENVLAAYRTAVSENYRFYSFGDAMLVI